MHELKTLNIDSTYVAGDLSSISNLKNLVNIIMKNIIVQGLGFVGSAMAVAIASKVNNKGFIIIAADGNKVSKLIDTKVNSSHLQIHPKNF